MAYSSRDFPDFHLKASLGRIKGISTLFKFGANSDIDIATVPETVWSVGGEYPWPSAAATTTIVSTSANDAVGGTGARSVTVLGLDANYDQISETVNMNGLNSVTLSNKYLRVYRAYVETVGSNTRNVGTINIAHGATTIAQIVPLVSQTQMAVFTVPRGYKLALTTFYLSIEKSTKVTTAWAHAHFCVRPFGGAFRMQSELDVSSYGTSSFQRTSQEPWFVLDEKTDVCITIFEVSDDDTSIAASFDGYLINMSEFET